jgi:hypothetical protein
LGGFVKSASSEDIVPVLPIPNSLASIPRFRVHIKLGVGMEKGKERGKIGEKE